MSGNLPSEPNDLLASALLLPATDRVALAKAMLESVEDFDDIPQAEIDDAWDGEIARRIAEIESGKVKTIPSSELWKELGGKPNVGN
jgi:putative addiction module component (TIGR02574 family)